ncbi:hypothetical protein BVRB_3g070070 [Beta vulgaris subsp. vulgaris]|nr:hypothetical protein BVRB_3g070070 [Beta vulgaris subsp. vulgaris]
MIHKEKEEKNFSKGSLVKASWNALTAGGSHHGWAPEGLRNLLGFDFPLTALFSLPCSCVVVRLVDAVVLRRRGLLLSRWCSASLAKLRCCALKLRNSPSLVLRVAALVSRAPQIDPIPPSTSKPSCSVPKAKKTGAVPIPEEQHAVPKPKEQTAAPNPSQTAPSSSQNPTIGSTYTLAHARRLDSLFSLVMGHSEAMMEFATEAKDLNGLVKGVMHKVDKALDGQQEIMARLGEISSSLQAMNSRLLKLEDIVLKGNDTLAENHQEVMAKLHDVVEEVEQPMVGFCVFVFPKS